MSLSQAMEEPFKRNAIGGLVFAMMSAIALPALAADPPKDPDSAKKPDAPKKQPPPKKREVPRYDGRDEETTGGDVALWVPRVLVSPLYLGSEYVVRRPLGALVRWAEHSNLPKALYELFTFGPDHSAGFAPIGFLDFGFNPSVGLYVFWNDAFAKGNDIRVHATTWGEDWLAGVVTDRVRLGEGRSVTFRFAGIKRPDLRFNGVGPDARDSDRSRYGQNSLDGRVSFDMRLWRTSRLETWAGLKSNWFYNGRFGDDFGIVGAVANGKYALPDGFVRGYTAQYSGLHAAFDSRKPGTDDQSGVRVEFQAAQGSDFRSGKSGWMRYGGGVGAFLDLNEKGRVLSANVLTDFVDPLGPEPVPFTELVTVGGDGPMRGFLPGRLLGRSAAVATIRYRWPIWIGIDGALEASLGNVFDEHLKGLSVDKLRFSTAIGIETVGSPDSAFQLLAGLGTETFEQGAKVDSFRLVIGTNRGF